MIRTEAQPGWVLHRRPWRETSLLIEFFGPDCGRIGLVARGARSARSNWRGLAEPFMPLSASWTRRGEMGTVTALESHGAATRLQGRILWCGLYANELLMRLLARDDPAPEIFHAYAKLLAELASGAAPGAPLRRFELALLAGIGVAPDLHVEAVSGEPIEAGRMYHLGPEAGFVAAQRPGPMVFEGAVIRALAAGGEQEPTLAAEMRRLTRMLIDRQLDGRPLQTRRLFETGQPVKREDQP